MSYTSTILVTGGAGYIGSAVVQALLREGYNIVILDNLSRGRQEVLPPGIPLHIGDLTDKTFVERVFCHHRIDIVIHLAGYKYVAESIANPSLYTDNIIGTQHLLETMVAHQTPRIIFSSSAAVYGIPQSEFIEETHPTIPVNFYGHTKLTCEALIQRFAAQHQIQYTIFRYFNVIGYAGIRYPDHLAYNIFPAIQQVLQGEVSSLAVYGSTYPTRDGTCIRDYVALCDIVNAHLYALESAHSDIYNLGTGQGITVLELLTLCEQVTQQRIPYTIHPPRPGDVARLVTSAIKAKEKLGWEVKRKIKEAVCDIVTS